MGSKRPPPPLPLNRKSSGIPSSQTWFVRDGVLVEELRRRQLDLQWRCHGDNIVWGKRMEQFIIFLATWRILYPKKPENPVTTKFYEPKCSHKICKP